MKLIVTTTHATQAAGYHSSTANPICIALAQQDTELEDIEVHNGRLTATRGGFPVRYLITGYTPEIHRQLLSGNRQAVDCELKALAVPMLVH